MKWLLGLALFAAALMVLRMILLAEWFIVPFVVFWASSFTLVAWNAGRLWRSRNQDAIIEDIERELRRRYG